jgi:excisionase family DNA binding protein
MSRIQSQKSTRYSKPIPNQAQNSIPAGQLLSTPQAALYLGVSVNTVRKYLSEGKIAARKVGVKLIKFDPADLDEFAKRFDNR